MVKPYTNNKTLLLVEKARPVNNSYCLSFFGLLK